MTFEGREVPRFFIYFTVFISNSSVSSSLARFYVDLQELVLNDSEVHHLRRLWHEMSSFSNFMETLRNNPSVVSGETHSDHHSCVCLTRREPFLLGSFCVGRGLKIEDMLKDDEVLTSYLLRDARLADSVVYQLVNARLRLEQVKY